MAKAKKNKIVRGSMKIGDYEPTEGIEFMSRGHRSEDLKAMRDKIEGFKKPGQSFKIGLRADNDTPKRLMNSISSYLSTNKPKLAKGLGISKRTSADEKFVVISCVEA